MTPRKRLYHPGERAPVSGKYKAIHVQHRPSHVVLLIRGEELPTCRSCKAGIRFVLVEAVSHAMHDMDFAGAAVA
jgi:hypothetical protein